MLGADSRIHHSLQIKWILLISAPKRCRLGQSNGLKRKVERENGWRRFSCYDFRVGVGGRLKIVFVIVVELISRNDGGNVRTFVTIFVKLLVRC